jgi:protein-S-isoprenylcysteine O-methyltransferase Ste14
MVNSLVFHWDNVWILLLINFVFSRGLFYIFPAYVNKRFSPVPMVRFYNSTSIVVINIFAILSLYISFSHNLIFLLSGFIFYFFGLTLMIAGIFYFAINEPDRLVVGGVYKWMRHPVYISNFIQWLAIAVLAQSALLLFVAAILIGIQHKIVVQEEKDLEAFYGEKYQQYCRQTKRYGLFN